MSTRRSGETPEREEGIDENELPELKISLGRDFSTPQKGANVARRKNALGRGLSALLSSSAVPVDISNIPLAGVGGSAIVENPNGEPKKSAKAEAPLVERDFSPPVFTPKPIPEAENVSNGPAPLAANHLSIVPETEPLEGGLVYLSLDRLTANPAQPRKHFEESELKDLSENIRKTGLLQPILVRRKNGESGQLASYEIVAGERRFRAAKKAGLVKVPAILKHLSDQETLEIGIIENVQRANLNPIEEAQAYQRLIDDFGSTQAEVAEKVGKDRTSVANLLRLLKLAPEVQELIGTGKLSAGHGRALLMCPPQEAQKELAKRILNEGLSVRQAELLASGKDLVVAPSINSAAISGPQTAGPLLKDKKALKKPANIMALEERLRRVLGTKVSLNVNEAGSGEVRLSFFSLEELQGLVERLEK